MRKSYLFALLLVAAVALASVLLLLSQRVRHEPASAAPEPEQANLLQEQAATQPPATEPSPMSGEALLGEGRDMALVEVLVEGPSAYRILHVYAGNIAHVGNHVGLPVRPGPINKRAGQHGLLLVVNDFGKFQVDRLTQDVDWFANILEDAPRYQQFKELAEDLEAYYWLPKEQRADALRKYASSGTPEVCMWAVFEFSREFPDAFASYAQDMIEHDRFTFEQQVQFVRAIHGDKAAPPLLFQMLSKWAKAHPSSADASTMTTYIWHETVTPPDDSVLLLPICVTVVLNKAFPLEERDWIVKVLAQAAEHSEKTCWVDALKSILSSTDEPTLRDAATAAIAHARSPQSPATHVSRAQDLNEVPLPASGH